MTLNEFLDALNQIKELHGGDIPVKCRIINLNLDDNDPAFYHCGIVENNEYTMYIERY